MSLTTECKGGRSLKTLRCALLHLLHNFRCVPVVMTFWSPPVSWREFIMNFLVVVVIGGAIGRHEKHVALRVFLRNLENREGQLVPWCALGSGGLCLSSSTDTY